MISPPANAIRPNTTDPERLAELEAYSILDTPAEEGFDDVVHIARLICDAPVALVSFVAADRQWFKARVGFPPCETDLKSSVCAYALSEPDLLIIRDLSADPRTAGNPLVIGEPHIRFYAGAPLRTETGRVLGSLCVIDGKPRPEGLTDGQADALRRLARQVMTLLRERRQLFELKAGELMAKAASVRRAALLELGDFLRDVSSVSQMTAKAAEIVGRTLGGNRAGYGELDAPGEVLTIHKDWTAQGAASLLGVHRLADYGDIAPVIERGETLVVDAVSEDQRTSDKAGTFADLDIKAILNAPVREGGRTVGVFYVHSPEPRAWAQEEVAFARNVADRVQQGIARLRAEEQRETLNRELSHRMKNVLAMALAIGEQTIRSAPDLDTAGKALSARLVAMGKAHEVLLRGDSNSGSLAVVVRGALAIHDDAQMGRLRLEGPHVIVGSKAALSLALMINELATNAAKYGALSTASGFVTVRWEIYTVEEAAMLRLCWVEKDGPPVTPPTRRGFGTRLITRGLAGAIGGKVELSYPPEGVVCELTAPLAEVQSNE